VFGQFGNSRAMSANVVEIERRLRSLEQRLERASGRVPARAEHTADHLGEAIASALSSIADHFRADVGPMTDATKIGAAAAKVGNDALRRLSREAPVIAGGSASTACNAGNRGGRGNSDGLGESSSLTAAAQQIFVLREISSAHRAPRSDHRCAGVVEQAGILDGDDGLLRGVYVRVRTLRIAGCFQTNFYSVPESGCDEICVDIRHPASKNDLGLRQPAAHTANSVAHMGWAASIEIRQTHHHDAHGF
jgi:hypothetical protein